MGQSSHKWKAGLIATGLGVDVAGICVLAAGVEEYTGRLALGVMIVTSLAVLVSIVLIHTQATRAHFDALVEANALRLTAVEQRIDQGEATAYGRGLQDGRGLNGQRHVRIT